MPVDRETNMKLYGVTPESKFREYVEIGFQIEHREALLEDWLENNPDDIVENGQLLVIGRQVTTNLGSFIDLLAIDRQGDVVVIELKRDRTPRETIAQALEYASFIEKIGYEQLEDVLRSYTGDESINLAQYHREYFALSSDEASVFNHDQRIVIVGQTITPEIRQVSTFLRNKGIHVTCLEFTFFKSNDGQQLLSTDIVIGKEPATIKKISTSSLPTVSKDEFIESLDRFGKPVFEKILEFAEQNAYPIHWGTKGFSLNVDIHGTHVAVCFGYPPKAVFRQAIYTALIGRGGLLSKVDVSEEKVIALGNEAQATGLFQSAGREFKCLINREFSSDDIEKLMRWLQKSIDTIKEHGLKGQKESES